MQENSKKNGGLPAASQGPSGERVKPVNVQPVNKPEVRSLYKKREQIYPQRAEGRFRQIKWLMMGLTLTIYYLAPWLRWDRGANAPDQAIRG